MPARTLRITGNVQGVFFRAHAKEEADRLGVSGWVRNEPDGSVAMHAEGKPEALDQLEHWCHEGPAAAEVDMVRSQDVPETGCTEFAIQY